MRISFSEKFQYLPRFLVIGFILMHCQISKAAQDAMVMVERAVIYADEKMSSPIGFVRRGKKIKVGDVARNKGQVYTLIVSGKVAYIKVTDLSTEKESVDSERLVAERFQKATSQKYKSNTSVLLLMNSTQINLNQQNGKLKDNDSVSWTGVSIKGGVQTSRRFDFELLLNYLMAKEGNEEFRAVEFGGGGGLRIFEKGRFITRLTAHIMSIPFASYALGSLFRVNGYGYSMGTGVNLSYRLTEKWGFEGYGGIHYMKLLSIDPPSTYKTIEPSFVGNRLGLGVNYQF